MKEENKEKVLDLTKIVPLLLKSWKLYLITFVCVVILSLAFIFTIPRYYTCKIMLAPESVDSKSGLNSMLSSFGLGNFEASEDAISPMLYPDLMESQDFIVSLFPVKITTKKGDISCSYYDYILKHTKSSWYMNCINAIIEQNNVEDEISPKAKKAQYSRAFMLSKLEWDITQAIAGNLKYDYDKKTSVISVTVTDQDPLVCALIADTVSHRLQDFIMDYRTKKARNDLEYAKKIHSTAKQEYEAAYATYAAAVDGSWDLVNETVKAQLKKLENDKDMKYQIMSATTQKLETAKAKLQEATPVITELQAASVPLKPAGPKRVFLTLGLLVLAFFFTTLYVISKNRASLV